MEISLATFSHVADCSLKNPSGGNRVKPQILSLQMSFKEASCMIIVSKLGIFTW